MWLYKQILLSEIQFAQLFINSTSSSYFPKKDKQTETKQIWNFNYKESCGLRKQKPIY